MNKFIWVIQRLIVILVISGTIYSAQHKDNWDYNKNINFTNSNLTSEQLNYLKQ